MTEKIELPPLLRSRKKSKFEICKKCAVYDDCHNVFSLYFYGPLRHSKPDYITEIVGFAVKNGKDMVCLSGVKK